MTIKSFIDYACPQCGLQWLPFDRGSSCPACGRVLPDGEITAIMDEALESAQYNIKLYGRYELEFWTVRRLGDDYLRWGFRALQNAYDNPTLDARSAALTALMDIDLESMAPHRTHILDFLERLIMRWREKSILNPKDWEKMPEPEKPFFGRPYLEK